MLQKIGNDLSAREFLSQAKFYEGYSRFNTEKGRYENWTEAVDRVMNMHKTKYAHLVGNPEFDSMIARITDAYKEKLFLGAQRALQFGGEQLLKHEMRLYNCFSPETKFVTNVGMKSFLDFKDGDETTVLTHTGNWRVAKIKKFGKQPIKRITFTKGNGEYNILATENHRWILYDGSETTKLKEGDRLYKEPKSFELFSWENSTPEEKLYWVYGFVYGDGTVTNNGHSMVRLCGHDKKYEERFLELGFKTSSSSSLDGDIMAFTGTYKKTLPDPEKDSIELLRAFVRGYMDADGSKNIQLKSNGSKFVGIQSSNPESIEFIRKVFPIVGVNIISEKDLTGQKTNYGIRPYTILFRTNDSSGSKYNSGWKVKSITESGTDDVWCLEVEDDHSFVLEGGIVTGNCSGSYADRPAFFNEFFYILLCGAGAGYSVQKHHIAKLPAIKPRTRHVRTHVIEDSIEGWADALAALMSSFFVGGGVMPQYEGKCVYFDPSLVRRKGSMISGGFLAPGPKPLIDALFKVEAILNERAQFGFLRPIDVYDISCHVADAVLSGGVRRAATICLFSPDDTEMLNAKTGNWYNLEPQRARSNNSMVLLRNQVTLEFFLKTMESVKQFGEPGFIFVDDLEQVFNPCVEISFFPQIDGESGWQQCVAGNTKLLTNDGVVDIQDVVDKNIEIWNGENWSFVKPFKTGENRELYRVYFGDGSFLDATSNHKFLVKNRFEKIFREVMTKDLNNENEKYTLSVPRPNVKWNGGTISEKNAYNFGFILGDGNVAKRENGKIRKPKANIGGKYIDADFPLTNGHYSDILKYGIKNYYFNDFSDNDNTFAYRLKYELGLPKEIFAWDLQSIYSFFAGWIDTDGCITKSKTYRIYGREDKIRDGQLLLTKLGIISSVNKMSSSGTTTNKGIRNQDVWYLQIQPNGVMFSTKSDGPLEKTSYNKKGKYQTIVKIEKLDGLHDTFCFNEENLHQGVFNNVLTKQCNLVEGNGAAIKSKEDFFRMCRVAAELGTIQAGYTNFKYVSDATRRITEREALLGVSLTGWMNSPDILLNADTLRKGVEIIMETNKKVAKLLGINPAARATCVKPSGNASTLLGCAPATQGEHSERYLRISQMNKDTPVAKLMVEKNPYMIEESVWSEGKTDYVIMWPVIAPKGSKFKDDLHGTKFLENVKFIQDNWIKPGVNLDLCVNPKINHHNVSNTVTVKNDDWENVAKFVYENREYFAGISFISETGDKDYAQAPFTAVLTPSQIVKKYGDAALFASGLIVDSRNGFRDLWDACNIAINNGVPAGELKDTQSEWIRRFHKFADNFFDGDLKKTEYCMKDVDLLHKWNKIQQTIVPVDFNEHFDQQIMIDVDTMGALACSGPNGSCDIK